MTVKIYCINLDKRRDRWNSIQEQFSDIKELEVVRVGAIEHKYGHFGCSMSHVKAITLYMKDEPFIVIEDDCLIRNKENFYPMLEKILGWLNAHPDQWEIFNGNPSNAAQDFKCQILNRDLPIVRYNVDQNGGSASFIIYNTSSPNVRNKMAYFNFKVNSFNYLLRMGHIKKIRSYKHVPVIDNFLARNLVCVTTIPFITTQIKSYSNIEHIMRNPAINHAIREGLIRQMVEQIMKEQSTTGEKVEVVAEVVAEEGGKAPVDVPATGAGEGPVDVAPS